MQLAGAQQSYTQSEVEGTEPRGWGTAYNNPVVKLWLALYGHPLLGAFWGNHCPEQLRSIGCEPAHIWERDLHVTVSVYVDDSEIVGSGGNVKKA